MSYSQLNRTCYKTPIMAHLFLGYYKAVGNFERKFLEKTFLQPYFFRRHPSMLCDEDRWLGAAAHQLERSH